MESDKKPSYEREHASKKESIDDEDDTGDVPYPLVIRRIHPRPTENEDGGLLVKLQKRLKIIEHQNAYFRIRIEELERESPTEDFNRWAQDFIRLRNYVEMENASLRRQLASEAQVHRSLDILMDEFNAMSNKIDRCKEECIRLQTVLARNGCL